ncbi:MAG TPA: tyrosine-type recombinase/integrase [Pyrinomonadaceae bacterium]|nr:tyrosine-type recombinase/integrase [Pyrinomonadaceae bacterium]
MRLPGEANKTSRRKRNRTTDKFEALYAGPHLGTRLADAAVDILKIAELMGHQSILTTRRYTHATDEGKRAAIAQLASYRAENCHKFATNEMRLTSQPTASSVFA